MTKTSDQTFEENVSLLTTDTRERINTIRKIIRDVVPEAEEYFSYQIPGFKHKDNLFYYCGFPDHISLLNPFSKAFREHFKSDLKGYKTSRLVIQIPGNKPLPEQLIKEIVAFRKKENEDSAGNRKI